MWLSLPVGIIFALLCLTGSILVFQDNILELTNSGSYKVEKLGEKPLPIGRLFSQTQQQLPDSLVLSSVTIPFDPSRNYSFGIEGRRRASVLVDPYSGKIRSQSLTGDGGFFSWVLRLHRSLLFTGKRGEFSIGKFLVGITTLTSLFILITGVIIWIPKSVKGLKNRLRIKTKKGAYRFWFDLHLAGGIYASILLIAFCLTGLTWSFDWYRSGFYSVFGVEMSQGEGHGHPEGAANPGKPTNGDEPRKTPENASPINHGEPSHNENRRSPENNGENHGQHGEYAPRRAGEYEANPAGKGNATGLQRANRRKYHVWETVVDNLKKQNTTYRFITVQDGVALFVPPGESARSADRYTFNAETGEITDVSYYKERLTPAAKLRSWTYLIHVGRWGGLFTQILSFLACLIGVLLTISGYYMYFKRRSLRKNRKSLKV